MAAVVPSKSANNPFRNPSPQPAGGVLNSSIPSTSSAPPPSSPAAGPPPPIYFGEEPPEYTPRPDVYDGEATLEIGPRRPFQPAPQVPPPQQQYAPPPTVPQNNQAPPPWATSGRPSRGGGLVSLITSLAGTITSQINESREANRVTSGQGYTHQPIPQPPPPPGSHWSNQQNQSSYAPPPGPPPRPSSNPNPSLQPPPPPLHPTSTRHSHSNSWSDSGHPKGTSDFARDFYAAGTGDLDGAAAGSSSGGNSSNGPFAPPSGPPPSHLSPQPTGAPSGSGGIPDDGRPTTTPVPGHPLLKDGKLLVYPTGYECEKCHNTGYKHYDPSHACKKCWNKYGKPFNGPLTYAFGGSSSSSSSSTPNVGTPSDQGSKSFQRALPRVNPYAPPPPRPHRDHHDHHRHQHNYIQRPSSNLPPGQAYAHSQGQRGPVSPPLPPRIRTMSPYAPTPPNAVVYQAGDPRIGGRLCTSCYGSGKMTFLIFEDQCDRCGGLGRVF
ncbi:hypothetical protein BDN72DRAFT_850461 [Pluteus cervinus]|uniref:Uncharacterized protein n=1 Tax=Pluteus cervinus TaxID=181527 RepID=A0ACD3A473_9AGAR|nr:hypothetical protein BDN72DRAFT_850461 [Pluteus cervinus]